MTVRLDDLVWHPAELELMCASCGGLMAIEDIARHDAWCGVDRSPVIERWINGEQAAKAYRDAQAEIER